MITRRLFDALSALATMDDTDQDAGHCNDPSGVTDDVMMELQTMGFVRDGRITADGLKALEPYRVRRAIFIAAGFGSRLVPITINTPKPLVRVNGERIIDTLIDACLGAGIDEIYIVRGYLGEQFDQLLYKYPMIRFIDNVAYDRSNNISSALCAKSLLGNSYVLESDLLIKNPKIITRYHYSSDVLGIYKEHSDDWVLTVDDEGYVDEEKIGGTDCYQMVGIYYLNAVDGARLADDLEEAFHSPGGKDRYWETVPNQIHKGEYRIYVRGCEEKDIIEIDTFRELKAIDKAYDL